MKKKNITFSKSFNFKSKAKPESSKNKKRELTSRDISPYYKTLLNNNNNIIKIKNLYKFEKIKERENIFKLLKDISKIQIKKDKILFNKNKKKLLQAISVLNNANIDENIVLNKYFSYLKKSGVEYNKLMEIKYKNMLTPIKKKEKEIQNMKKNIYFYKSISNQMLIKYMIDNKEKLKEYMQENYSYRNKNTESNRNYSPKTLCFSDKSKSKPNLILNERKKNFLTCSNDNNNNNNIMKLYLKEQILKDKKIVPRLKLEENHKYIYEYSNKNTFITSRSRNKNKFNLKNKAMTMIYTPKSSYNINNKYFTPQIIKRKNKLNNYNSTKSTYKTNCSTRGSRNIKNVDFNKMFNRNKINKLNYLTIE